MGSIKTTSDNFPDILIMFMVDSIMNNKNVIQNEKWDEFTKKLKDKGIMPLLLKYYIGINAIDKSKFKSISDVFHDKGNKSTINIVKNGSKKPETSTIKRMLKKAIMVSEKKKIKYNGAPLHDNVISGIINSVVDEFVNNGDIKGDIDG